MEKVTVVTDRRSIIGEGPHWDSRINKLLYVDIPSGVIARLNTETKEEEELQFPNEYISFAIPSSSDPNKLVIGRNKELHLLNWQNNETTLLGDVEAGCQTRFNDGKCDSTGRLWAGTMAVDLALITIGVAGNLYSFDSETKLKTRKSNVGLSNGLAWNSSNRKMFYIDSIPGKVSVFDYDVSNGNISNERIVADFSNAPYRDLGLPDGMTIDENDKLWVACFNGSCVLHIDPNTGTILKKVPLPAMKITSCCFGGPNYDELYVTSGCKDMTDSEMLAKPLSGAVFKVTGLGVKGRPLFNFNA